jgi:putative endonuclease
MSLFLPPRTTGTAAEERAKSYLERQGLRTLERNFHSRRGEIDLVMQEHDTLVFVEVRFRKNNRFGSAMETVTRTKQQRIVAAARLFLASRQQWAQAPCRFDVLAISGQEQENIDWIRDAFRPTS